MYQPAAGGVHVIVAVPSGPAATSVCGSDQSKEYRYAATSDQVGGGVKVNVPGTSAPPCG
ncbi:hypothetical protein ACIQMJ_27135 [Actinosynnema sp. NPDC091369]